MRHEPTRRTLRVVELLAAAQEPVSTTTMSRELGASRSTLHAVIGELAASGWAERSGTGWLAGPGLRSLARSLGAEPDLARTARPALEAAADATGVATATLRVRADSGIVEVVDAVRGGVRTSSSPPLPVGHTIPLRAPFVRDVAAHLPEPALERWWADAGDLSPEARARLERVLPQVRRRGCSVDRLTPARRELVRMATSLEAAGIGPLVRDRVSELFVELSAIDVLDAELTPAADLAVFAVSAPVLGPGGAVVGSIAATPGRRMTGRAVLRTIDAVTDAAAGVSALLDRPAPPGPPPPARLRPT